MDGPLSSTLESTCAEAFVLLRTGEFLRAHERFEDAWRSASGELAEYFRAYAQLAAAHHS